MADPAPTGGFGRVLEQHGQRARCAACGAPVDVLRAPAIRMTSQGVLVYCSTLHRELPVREPSAPGLLVEDTASSSIEEPEPTSVPGPVPEAEETSEPKRASESKAASAMPEKDQAVSELAPRPPREFAPTATLVLWVLLVLGLLGVATIEWSHDRPVVSELVLAGVITLWALAGQRMGAWLGQASERERRQLGARLGTRVRRLRDQELTWISVRALRPGEALSVEAGESVPCDGVVLQGEGTLEPFPDCAGPIHVEPGLRVSAGASLVSGAMHVVCTAAGADRTFDALHAGLRSRETSLSRASRGVRHRVAPLVGVGSFVMGVWLSESWLVGLSVALANFAALVSPLPERLIGTLQDTWLLLLARQGVDFGAEGLDAAGHVQVAVFCARGTFLAGEPEVTDIVGLGGAPERDVLALAAGAESVAAHPAAASIRRAAHDRHVSPEPTRGHDVLGGMGVTCYSADGHRVLVGTRELMMKEKVSIALSEETLRKMEQRGRSGILVAKAGRLIGLLALHDALRKGARAAVQLLLDVHIEPVLLSGEARNATEALGRALSIEHVRPEVPARERAAEVRRVIEGGAAVAVVGHSPLDDSALSAASVPIVLDGSALTPRPRSVTLLGDDVLTAAHALVAAQLARRDGLVALVLCLAPAFLGVLCTSSLLFPPVVAPLGSLLGGIAGAAWVWSRLERALRFQRKLPTRAGTA